MLAVVAICLPPLLVQAVSKLYHRHKQHPAVEGFVQGLSLAVVGVFVVVLARILVSNRIDARSLLIMAASVALGASERVPFVLILALAGLTGFLCK